MKAGGIDPVGMMVGRNKGNTTLVTTNDGMVGFAMDFCVNGDSCFQFAVIEHIDNIHNLSVHTILLQKGSLVCRIGLLIVPLKERVGNQLLKAIVVTGRQQVLGFLIIIVDILDIVVVCDCVFAK